MASPIIPIAKPPSSKLLLILPFWQGDKAQAMALARLIADIEPAHNQLADFLFVNRFDTPPDRDTVKYVSRKFNVFSYQSARRSIGWPRGCNGLFFGSAEYFYHMSAENRKTPRYKAAFFLEADFAPLNRDWVRIASGAWDALKGRAVIMGRRVQSPNIAEHINGCALLSGDLKFLNWLVKRVGEPADCGWDYCLAGEFRRWGVAELPGMEFIWRTSTLSESDLRRFQDSGTVYLHGVKDFSALNFARKTLL